MPNTSKNLFTKSSVNTETLQREGIDNYKSRYGGKKDSRSIALTKLSPSIYTRLKYWDVFINNEIAKHSERYDLIKEYEDNRSKSIVKHSISKKSAAKVKEELEKEAEVKKPIFDKILKDLGDLAIGEAKSFIGAASNNIANAENALLGIAGNALDSVATPLVNTLLYPYNFVRNAAFDALDSVLGAIVGGAGYLAGLIPEKPLVIENGKSKDVSQEELIVQLKKESSKAINDAVSYLKTLRRESPDVLEGVSGTGEHNKFYIVQGLFDNMLPGEEMSNGNVTDGLNTPFSEDLITSYIASTLQPEINSAIDNISYNWQSLFKTMMGSPAEERSYIVMGLMEAAKGRVNAFNYVQDILNYGAGTSKLMEIARNYRPSELLKRFLYSDVWHKTPEKLEKVSKIVDAVVPQETIKTISLFSHLNELKTDADELLARLSGRQSSPKGNNLGPANLWGDIMNTATTNDTYGMSSIIKSFKINRQITSGEVDYYQNGYSHIFFIKPDLNLTENAVYAMDMGMNPMLGDLIHNLNYNDNELEEYWSIFPTVHGGYDKGTNPFVSYLMSNMIKSLPILDINLETKDAWENAKGFKMSYGIHHFKSTWGGDFTIPYNDTKNLFVTNLIQMWIRYISVVKEGIADCAPKKKNRGALDYLGAVYYFITEPDGQSIVHWGRYTGIYPTGAPFSAINTDKGNQDVPEFSAPFKYQIYESNDVNLLRDFNYIMNGGPLSAQTSSSEDKADSVYWTHGGIHEAKSLNPMNDINLRAGPVSGENHASVWYIPVDASASQGLSFSENLSRTSEYKFVLKFDSTPDFQLGLFPEERSRESANTNIVTSL